MKIAINIRQTAPERFRADCTVMPGCVAFGRTREQASENMRSEIASYIASMDGVVPHQLDMIVAPAIQLWEKPEPDIARQDPAPTGRWA